MTVQFTLKSKYIKKKKSHKSKKINKNHYCFPLVKLKLFLLITESLEKEAMNEINDHFPSLKENELLCKAENCVIEWTKEKNVIIDF